MYWRYDPLIIWNCYKACFYAAVALLLSGCTTEQKIQPVTTSCPKIAVYDPSWQSAFADELMKLKQVGQYPHIERFIIDGVQIRQELKACQS